jgi:hypothetical protein
VIITYVHIYAVFFTTVELIKKQPVWFYQALEINLAVYLNDSIEELLE